MKMINTQNKKTQQNTNSLNYSEKNVAPHTRQEKRGGGQPRRTRTRVASVSLHTSPHTQHTDHNNSQFLNRPNRNWLNNCAFSRILTSGQQYRSFSTFFVAKFGSQSSDVFAEFVLIIFSGMIFASGLNVSGKI